MKNANATTSSHPGFEQSLCLLAAGPFVGSGTTLIACEKAGRQARLIELEPRYCDVAVTRWQRWSGLTATLSGDGRTFEKIAAARGQVDS